jgi:hypothetical protein
LAAVTATFKWARMVRGRCSRVALARSAQLHLDS